MYQCARDHRAHRAAISRVTPEHGRSSPQAPRFVVTGVLAGGLLLTPALGVMPATAGPNTSEATHTAVDHLQPGQHKQHSDQPSPPDQSQPDQSQPDQEKRQGQEPDGDEASAAQRAPARSASTVEETEDTVDPSHEPSPSDPAPTDEAPTHEPTEGPTHKPTQKPTHKPTDEPTEGQTEDPTGEPVKSPSATSSPTPSVNHPSDSERTPGPPVDDDHRSGGGHVEVNSVGSNAPGAVRIAADSAFPVRHVNLTRTSQETASETRDRPSTKASPAASSSTSKAQSQHPGTAHVDPGRVGPPQHEGPVLNPSKPDTRVSAEGNGDRKRLGIPWAHDGAQVAGLTAAGLGVLVLGGVAFFGLRKRS